MVLATASSLTVASWIGRGDETAEAATPAIVAQAKSPVATPPSSGASTVLPKDEDGHFWAEARIDGGSGDRAVRLMVDTGASVVALTRDDARRLGFNLTPSDFTGTVVTASGEVAAARVQLDTVIVGSARVERVEALVVETGLTHSLLGMSYLGRLAGFTATPTGLSLIV